MTRVSVIKEVPYRLPLTKKEIEKLAQTVLSVATKARPRSPYLAQRFQDIHISLVIASNRKVRSLNKKYRGKDKVTDILSFPVPVRESVVDRALELGDLIIAPEYIQKDYRNFHTTLKQHYRLLIAHGILHLLGYDHMTSAELKKMQSLEQKILAKLS